MAGERQQLQAAAAEILRRLVDPPARQGKVGAAHPVAQQAIERIGKTASVPFHVGDGAGQGGDGGGIEGGDAHAMVGMEMGDIDPHDRLAGQIFRHFPEHVAIADRRAGIDQQRAGRGGDDRNIGDRAAIGEQHRFVGAMDHPQAIGHPLRIDAIIIGCGAGQQGEGAGHAGQRLSAVEHHRPVAPVAAGRGDWRATVTLAR